MRGNNLDISKSKTGNSPAWLLFFITSIFFLGWGIIRGDFAGKLGATSFILPAAIYLFSFGIYLHYQSQKIAAAVFAGIICRAGLIFVLPHFSDDFYRFLWDGRIANLGVNPYSITPEQYINQFGAHSDSMLSSVFPHLNSVSWPTVYPPILQYCFRLATALFPASVEGATIVLKMLVFIAECTSLFFLWKILEGRKKPGSLILLYALNPLVIFELSGNLHFEAFMITGLLGMLYFLQREKFTLSGGLLAFSISAKLLPLLLIPALFFRLKFRDFTKFVLPALTIPMFLFYVEDVHLFSGNFGNGLSLYFQKFEFNAGIYFFSKWLFSSLFGNFFWLLCPVLYLVFALTLSIHPSITQRISISKLFGFILGGYLLFSSTIHPWYISPLIALAVISDFRFPILWSFFLFLTYVAYYLPGNQIPNVLLWIEYFTVISLFTWEILSPEKQKMLFSWLLKKTLPFRLSTKKTVLELLAPGKTVLDIGCGYGALTSAIQQKEIEVTSLDIENKSLLTEVNPILFNGKKIPFPDQRFDFSLLITVLHHTNYQKELLTEAARTGKKIIVMEDIYTNIIQKQLTFYMDSLVNLEFKNHPHSNRDDAGWKQLFKELNLEILEEKHFRTLLFFRQVVYLLEKKQS